MKANYKNKICKQIPKQRMYPKVVINERKQININKTKSDEIKNESNTQ